MSDDHFLNLQPGTIVNGCYEVVKSLGAGSMGVVYACRHRDLSGKLVAMKVLFSEVAQDSVAAARFRNEIFAAYEVSHPNVVKAYEYFRDGDIVAFTMEYVGGGDLADKIGTGANVSIKDVIKLMTQMCSGVQAIHDAGIVHRDLKPENLLLTVAGDVKITDFGIARTGSGPKLTEHGGVVGTIDYVSPEYIEVGQVDSRSDIYALGVLSYELITGVSPFKGESVFETITMRLKTDPKRPDEIRPDCPPALANVIMKALRRDPELRYASAAQMQYDLEQCSVSGGTSSIKSLPVKPVSTAPRGDSSSQTSSSSFAQPSKILDTSVQQINTDDLKTEQLEDNTVATDLDGKFERDLGFDISLDDPIEEDYDMEEFALQSDSDLNEEIKSYTPVIENNYDVDFNQGIEDMLEEEDAAFVEEDLYPISDNRADSNIYQEKNEYYSDSSASNSNISFPSEAAQFSPVLKVFLLCLLGFVLGFIVMNQVFTEDPNDEEVVIQKTVDGVFSVKQ